MNLIELVDYITIYKCVTHPPSPPACMRNCFIGHCLCSQLLYHSFTEGGVSLTTNQFESAPRDPSPWKHRAPLSGQRFVSPACKATRGAPLPSNEAHEFPDPSRLRWSPSHATDDPSSRFFSPIDRSYGKGNFPSEKSPVEKVTAIIWRSGVRRGRFTTSPRLLN